MLYNGPPGGGIAIVLSLLPNGALDGELEVCCGAFKGDFLLCPACGGLNTIFLLDEAFLRGPSGEILRWFEGLFENGIGAWSNELTGSW